MHMTLVIVAGLMLLGVFGLFGWLWGHDLHGTALAAKVFVPVWLAVALANMWVGVTKAGYTVAQELPILAIVFLVPAAVALAVSWKLAAPAAE